LAELFLGVGSPSEVPWVGPGEARLAVGEQGCAACQRSSKRRRRFDQDANSNPPGGTAWRELSRRIWSGSDDPSVTGDTG